MTNEELKKKIVDVINVADISVVLRRNDIIILAENTNLTKNMTNIIVVAEVGTNG